MTTDTVLLLTPEIVLIAAAVAIYLGGAFSTARRAWGWVAGAAVALAAAALWTQHVPTDAGGPIVLDVSGAARPLAGPGVRRAVGAADFPPLEHRRHFRIRRFAAADHRRADARGRRGRSGPAVRRPGADLDPHLHAALSRPARCSVPGVGREILLPQRAGLGDPALRVQLPLRRERIDGTGRDSSRDGGVAGRGGRVRRRWPNWRWC